MARRKAKPNLGDSGRFSSAVTPEGAPPFAFKRAVPTTPPMAEWPADFLRRRRKIGAETLSVWARRAGTARGFRAELCYSVDGPPVGEQDSDGGRAGGDGAPTVVAFHGCGGSKTQWLLPEPIEGVRLVAVDRLGHGGSSDETELLGKGEHCLWDELLPIYVEFLDDLLGTQAAVYLCGHGQGGLTALLLSAALGTRCLGCAVFAAPADPTDASKTAKEGAQKADPTHRRSVQHIAAGVVAGSAQEEMLHGAVESRVWLPNPPHVSFDAAGCGGPASRLALWLSATRALAAKRSGGADFGAAQEHAAWAAGGGDGGALAELDADLFFAAASVASVHNGARSADAVLCDWRRQLTPLASIFAGLPFSLRDTRCRTILCHGELDAVVAAVSVEVHRAAIGNDALVEVRRFAQHGHQTLLLEWRAVLHELTRPAVAAKLKRERIARGEAEVLAEHHKAHEASMQEAGEQVGIVFKGDHELPTLLHARLDEEKAALAAIEHERLDALRWWCGVCTREHKDKPDKCVVCGCSSQEPIESP